MKRIYTFPCLLLFTFYSGSTLSEVGDKYSCELVQRPWIESHGVSNKPPKDWPNKMTVTIDWKEDDIAILRRLSQSRYDDGTLGNPTDSWELPDGGLVLKTKGIWHPHLYGLSEYHYGFEGEWRSKLTGHVIRFFPWFRESGMDKSFEPKKLLWIQYGESEFVYNIHVWDFNCKKSDH